MPMARRFKIAVQFDLAEAPAAEARESAPHVPLTPELLAMLQTDLPLSPEPFAQLAAAHGRSEEEVRAALRSCLADGRMRRYGALVNHRRLGFTANAMLVLRVPEERIEEVGTRLSASPEVSHCYQRPPFEEFPYNLYAMVHARDRAQCLEIAGALVEGSGIAEWAALFSTKEYRKSSPDYGGLMTDGEKRGDRHDRKTRSSQSPVPGSPVSRSETLFAEAQAVIPGGVNSPVRAFKSVGGTPRFSGARRRGAGVGCRRE